MASTTLTAYNELRRDIAARKLAPVYLLYGEEGYYIDRLIEALEAVVPDDERDFNLYTFYGADSTPERVIEACRRYPMMADRVVVILREAQAMRADILNRLHTYVEKPVDSTVLVIVLRDKEPKGRNLTAALRKKPCVMFESRPHNDREITTVISSLIKERGLNIEAKGMAMLRDFVGNNVQRLHNEIDKLALILGKGAMVTPEAIERNIGVSKDFNNFELIDALAERNGDKAFRIINYFRSNPKNNPTLASIAVIFNYFSNLLIMQFSPDKSERALMQACGFRSPYQLRSYQPALRNYNAFQTMEIIGAIREFDARQKGIGSRQNERDLFHELVFHILTAPGVITI